MQRGKLIVLLAPAVAVGWYDMIRAVDMISSEQCMSRVWSHTFAHPAACVWCHYAERMFIVLPAVVWYDIIRARSVTWSESHMCSFLTACVMSLCTEERKVDCTPGCYSWLIHVWSGQGLSRGWSHTCGRPSQRTIIYRRSMMSYNRLGAPPPPICIGRILQLRLPLMSYIYSALYAERWQRSTSAKDELICGCTSPFQEPHPRSNMIGLAIDTSTTASTTTTSATMAKLCTPWANNTLDLKIQMFCCMQ